MRSYGVGTAKSSRGKRLLYASLLVVGFTVGLGTTSSYAQSQQNGTQVNVTICTDSSSIQLTSPVSDSVVTQPVVPLTGTVQQASQIEVTVDGQFDGTIQLATGQTQFTGQVELSVGTHTIGLTAVNICSGTNMSTSAVITYDAPLATPSTGENTNTVVEGGTVLPSGAAIQTQPADTPTGGLSVVPDAVDHILKWLNIDTGSTGDAPASTTSTTQPLQKMTLSKAAVLGVGTALVAFGAPAALFGSIATLPHLSTVFGGAAAFLKTSKGAKRVRRIGRIVGVALVIAVFLI